MFLFLLAAVFGENTSWGTVCSEYCTQTGLRYRTHWQRASTTVSWTFRLNESGVQAFETVPIKFFFSLSGPQCELSGDPPQRAARAGDGGDHGGVLPGLLAALRSGGSALNLRPSWPSDPGGEHHAVAAGQVLHRRQPFHLHIHEQTGELSLCFSLHSSHWMFLPPSPLYLSPPPPPPPSVRLWYSSLTFKQTANRENENERWSNLVDASSRRNWQQSKLEGDLCSVSPSENHYPVISRLV